MTQILFVGIGGFVGSVTRFLLAGLVQGATAGVFPFGTLVVNVTGCVAIGGLSELLEARPFMTGDARAFLIIGLLGGFTTFSAFGNETINLLRGHRRRDRRRQRAGAHPAGARRRVARTNGGTAARILIRVGRVRWAIDREIWNMTP